MRVVAGTDTWAVRQEADRREATVGHTGYRRRRTASRPVAERLVATSVERTRDGDEAAHRLLYLLFADEVFGYVANILRSEHDAEDVTSEVFARLPRALANYRPGPSPFVAWLLRVARNVALDHLRHQRAVPFAEVWPSDEAVEDVAAERLEALTEALGHLPQDQRTVVLLRFVGGLSPAEVAERMGRSETAIHALLHRGRVRLREELTTLGSAPAALAA
jgi:RNA polymerase sigma-70 factor, ECF subfamily